MGRTVFAWISGWGYEIVPANAGQLEVMPGPEPAIMISMTGVWRTRRVLVRVSPDGSRYDVRGIGGTWFARHMVRVEKKSPATADNSENAERPAGWRIQTEFLSTDWPSGFVLHSSPVFPPPFELVGPADTRIWLQGPLSQEEFPPLNELAGEGQQLLQSVVRNGCEQVEFSYEFNRSAWRMMHVVLVNPEPREVFVLTGQATEQNREVMQRALDTLALGVRY